MPKAPRRSPERLARRQALTMTALSAVCGLAIAAVAVMVVANAAEGPRYEPTADQREACKQDLQRLCPGTMPGGGRVRQCFSTHYPDLSASCRTAFDAAGAAR